MIIAIDFDGTCVTYEYLRVGHDIGAVPVLQKLVQKKHQLILLTMRYDKTLKDAENWFKAYGIPLFGINRNPIQWKFSRSPKVYADLYIDDSGLGCPLKFDKTLSDRSFVDWEKTTALLSERKIL